MWSSSATLGLVVVACCLPVAAAEDLGALEVVGQRGQSLEQTRRDRYECHNWAVEQTGESPPAVPVGAPPPAPQPDLRRERVDRALIGAAIGGALGGIFGSAHGHGYHDDDSGENVLVGAAAGAAIGAATAGSRRKKEAAAAEPEGPSEYLRALTACLEGRGYSVRLPTAAELTASR